MNGSSVRLPIIGLVRMTEALRFTGKIQSAIVNRDADRWFIAISVEIRDPKQTRPQGKPIGVDLGRSAFATLSTGQKRQAPKPLQRALRQLRRLGRWHTRKQWKSRNRAKASRKLARQHRRIRNIRNDFLHKRSTDRAKTHSAIGIEDWNVKGMLQNRRLALHLWDAAWSQFGRPLKYKTALYGPTLTVHDCWYASSKTCSACGQKRASLELSERCWSCEHCGTTHDRDVNAAINLKPDTAGYAEIHACGEVGAVARHPSSIRKAEAPRGNRNFAVRSFMRTRKVAGTLDAGSGAHVHRHPAEAPVASVIGFWKEKSAIVIAWLSGKERNFSGGSGCANRSASRMSRMVTDHSEA